MSTQAQPVQGHPTTIEIVETLLKSPVMIINRIRDGRFGGPFLTCLLVLAACHLTYGLVVGGFSGGVQWLAAPCKLALGTAAAAVLCLPSLYVFSCLSGATLHPGQALQLLGSALTVTGVLLVAFVPVAFIFTFSTASLGFMGGLHLLLWGISLGFGLRFLRNGMASLEGTRRRFLDLWNLILVLTMLQMCTVLRPLMGTSEHLLTGEKRFFLMHWLQVMGL